MRYIGSKRLLLRDIEKVISTHSDGSEQTFLDLFAGTNIVGEHFKKKYTIISNDMLYFSYVNAKAIIENNNILTFNGLKRIGIKDPFVYFNNDDNIKPTGHYYEEAYTPTGGAMYFTVENGRRIDFIRDKIDDWLGAKLITETEYNYLVSALIQAVPFISNITGTYGAFLKKWDKRALGKLVMKPLAVTNNYRKNRSYNENSNQLIRRMDADIVYIDTPYNSRQYASNYHLLENIARNNKPVLKGKTKIFDWQELRSDYSMKKRALQAMEDLIKNIKSRHIVLSYSNEGIIPEKELIELINMYSTVPAEIHRIDYRKYESKVKSKIKGLNELLIYFSRQDDTEKIRVPNVKEEPMVTTWNPQEKQKYIKSPLNYIGGKYKLLPQILPLFPDKIVTFVDLFSGGANVGINVSADKHVFNDMNYRVNEMFRYFSHYTPDELVEMINKKIRQYSLSKTNKEGYLKFREDYNNDPDPLSLYVLVSYSYNYQIRFNNSMEFNNPFGKDRSSFSQNMEKNLRAFVDKLNNIDAEFTDVFFDEYDISLLSKDDFVYMDPPYLITTGNYNDGNRGFVNWGEEQEKKMYQIMDSLTNKGVKWALSNVLEHKDKTNVLLKTYINNHENIYVEHLKYTYKNSSYNTKRRFSDEVLITNYDPENWRTDRLF